MYRLPAMYYDDYTDRGLPAGKQISRAAHTVNVELTDDERNEMIEDAKYYASDQGWDRDLLPLRRSAFRALNALTKPI